MRQMLQDRVLRQRLGDVVGVAALFVLLGLALLLPG